MQVSFTVKGMKQTQAELERIAKELEGNELFNAVRDATLIVQRSAKKNVPVDTGRLRASITPKVETRGRVVQGVVGSNVVYAPFVERPGPVRRSGRRPWLRPAFEENMAKIEKRIEKFVATVTR